MNKKAKGRLGENRAAAFLVRNGFRIAAQNFRSTRGEVDIVARSKGMLVFVEVKTWDSYTEEMLEHAIDAGKQSRILHAAKYFLACNPDLADLDLRFDVILLLSKLAKIVHIENAFGE